MGSMGLGATGRELVTELLGGCGPPSMWLPSLGTHVTELLQGSGHLLASRGVCQGQNRSGRWGVGYEGVHFPSSSLDFTAC